MANKTKPLYTYREYRFQDIFPLIFMTENSPTTETDFFHFHNCIELAYCERGEKNFIVESQNFKLCAGDACFIPPYNMHVSYCNKEFVSCSLYHYVFFNVEDLLAPFYPNGLPQELQWYKYSDFPCILNQADFKQELFYIRQIIENLQSPTELMSLNVRGLVHSLMILLSRRFSTTNKMAVLTVSRTAILPAISYLVSHFEDSVSTDHLAALCHLTKNQFCNDFKFAMGQTPKQYLQLLRVQNSCELLLKTELSVLEIAMSSGFCSSSSFYHHFKSLIGDNPESWRHAHRTYTKKDYRYAPLLTLDSTGTGHSRH